MPSISSHIHLAVNLLHEDRSLDPWPFILGSLAPDCVDHRENGHFFNGSVFDHEGLLTKYMSRCAGSHDKSFVLGYHLHVWYDEYTRRKGFISLDNPDRLGEDDLKKALWAEVLVLDSPELLSFDKTVVKAWAACPIIPLKYRKTPLVRYEECIEEARGAIK